jgi:hypothetical protein
MDYPKEGSTSLYDYSDKSVQHAGYAAVAYAIVSLFSGLLAFLQYFLYYRPGTGDFQGHEFLSQQYLQHTPLVTAAAVAFSVIIAVFSGGLAFLIFWRSRFAVVAMLIFVVLFQLYTWSIGHSFAGTFVSIVVAGFCCAAREKYFSTTQRVRSKPRRSNHPIKPMAPLRNNFSVLTTTPCRGLSPSR